MKLNKKFLACFMAATMAIAPMTAFGDGASSTVTGNGSVNVPATEQYNVILPTSDGISFNVDPYGLLSVTDGTTLGDVLSGAASGTVDTIKSNPTAIINKSSMDINVKVSAYVTPSTTCALSLATTKAEAVSGTKDLYLAIAQYTDATISAVTTKAADITGDSAIVNGTKAISEASITVTDTALNVASATAITATTDSAATVLPISLKNMAEAYTVTSTGAVQLSEGAVTYNNENSYVFKIYGYANPNAEVWETLDDGSVDLTMKFEITSGEEDAEDTSSNVPTAPTKSSVAFADGTLTATILDSDLTSNTAPTKLYIQIGTKWYNMADYATVTITDKDTYYEITMTGYDKLTSGTTYGLRLMDADGVIYDGTVTAQ